MARKPIPEAPKASQTTAVTNWDEELARQAEVAAAMEANTGGGNYFSLKGGILALNDQAIPNNQMAVIILDSILENVFYEGAYNPDVQMPPTCFAFGRDDTTIAPHANVVERGQGQNEQCTGCPMNVFGTADTGRGKACRNTRRLGMIPAGDLDLAGKFTQFTDEEHFTTATAAFMKLPVTSVKGYATFVKQLSGALKRPPHGIFTKVKVIPDAKTQFRVIFEPIAVVPNNLMAIVMKRNQEVKAVIEQPYNLDVEAQPEKPAAKAKPANVRPPVKKPTKKY